MIRGHDIHWMQTHPAKFFNQINFEKELDSGSELFTGRDGLNNPVKIIYDREQEQILKIELLNSMDSTEVIEIISKAWTNSEYGKLVKEVDIIQAKMDTFNFYFEHIEINQ